MLSAKLIRLNQYRLTNSVLQRKAQLLINIYFPRQHLLGKPGKKLLIISLPLVGEQSSSIFINVFS